METVEDSNILHSYFHENFKLPRVVLWNENLYQFMPIKQKLYQVILATPKIIGSHAGQTKIVYQVVLRLKMSFATQNVVEQALLLLLKLS